jgi:hypothetical protein
MEMRTVAVIHPVETVSPVKRIDPESNGLLGLIL